MIVILVSVLGHFRRMFPYCNIRLSGLLPYAKYVIMVDVLPVDHFKYKVR